MNQPDPALGVILHAIGGLASASFYLLFRGVKGWSWESYWLVGGVFSWVVAPWLFALIQIPDLLRVLGEAPRSALLWSYLFGVLWGIGGLTFGLTMRYLGIALGMAMALGYCAAFGTLMPPLFRGELEGVARTTAGATVLFGVCVCLAGIVVSGLAGRSKERELTDEQKHAVIHEFSFVKGVLVATVSGILSACMSYGFAAGKPIAELAVQHGAHPLWQNLAGPGRRPGRWAHHQPPLVSLPQRPQWHRGRLPRQPRARSRDHRRLDLGKNYLLCAVAGTVWYLQFLFYGMGNTLMGKFEFSSWTLHMASIMIFGTLWGLGPQGMEGLQPAHVRSERGRAVDPRVIHDHRGLRQLPRHAPTPRLSPSIEASLMNSRQSRTLILALTILLAIFRLSRRGGRDR